MAADFNYDDPKVDEAYQKALKYLGFRARTQKEVDEYLKRKGFGEEVIEKAIEKLKEYGFIDDRAFALSWINSRMRNNPKGRAVIAFELRQKGVEGGIIDEVMASIPNKQEEEVANRLAQKYYDKYKEMDEGERVHKTVQALARRGFDWELIHKIMNRLTRELHVE
ncbi:regulatory protein [Caldicoprobacter guelmensis]|uniref:regulatory protein RecX n=1 Tax=Caldicoprobacter guelmensis TaxID=1170224 RepID=UPI00195E08A6|nr:regulatory protein RecX [Caldicoprobacter guelmensis]MBM7582472.1 regulatory protein [Caldicoprobacter guelmensis]